MPREGWYWTCKMVASQTIPQLQQLSHCQVESACILHVCMDRGQTWGDVREPWHTPRPAMSVAIFPAGQPNLVHQKALQNMVTSEGHR